MFEFINTGVNPKILFISQTETKGIGLQGGYLTKFCLGGCSAWGPNSNLLTIYIPFLTEKVLLSHTLIPLINGTPFTYVVKNFALIPFNYCKSIVF